MIRFLEVETLPDLDSILIFLTVDVLTISPTWIILNICHMSSGSSMITRTVPPPFLRSIARLTIRMKRKKERFPLFEP